MDHTTPAPSATAATPELAYATPDTVGLTRRQLGVAAAWAAPIIAVAATAPQASASIQNPLTRLSVLTTTELSGSTTVGAAISGSAGGDVLIINNGPGWDAIPVRALYTLTGQLASYQILYSGVEIFVNQIIVVGATTWVVTEYGPTLGGMYASLYVQGSIVVPMNGSVGATTPVLTFATTSTGVPTTGFPIKWQLEVGARANSDPAYSISDITGKSIPAA